MSDELEREISRRLEGLSRLTKLLWVLIAFAFGVGSWAARLEFKSHELEKAVEINRASVDGYKIWKSAVDASRFDSNKGNELQLTFSKAMNLQDMRIQRLESNGEATKESLKRIEDKLGTK